MTKWEEAVDKDFPPAYVMTEKDICASFKQIRFIRSSVRLMLGRASTTQEINDRRRRAMKKELI